MPNKRKQKDENMNRGQKTIKNDQTDLKTQL